MTFKEIANKLTGFSIPIFGVSWTPAKLEIDVAKKVITFLEDRRVLYVVYELESPQHCLSSILQIREFLTTQMFDLSDKSELANILRSMRSACRKFLDSVQGQYYFNKGRGRIDHDLGMGGQIHFYNAMGELRAIMGILLAKIIVMHGLNFEGELLNIIPFELPDE
ncbi:MAG: hypothetical protein QM687_11985 [Ferruginibacter sp.]